MKADLSFLVLSSLFAPTYLFVLKALMQMVEALSITTIPFFGQRERVYTSCYEMIVNRGADSLGNACAIPIAY